MIENKNYFMEKWEKNLESDNVLKRYKARQFIEILKKSEPLKGFNMDLFYSITEKMVVINDKKVVVRLLDGTEVECEIE